MIKTPLRATPLIHLIVILGFGGVSPIMSWAQSTNTTGSPLKFEEPKFLTAAIYQADRKELQFRFTRQATRSGSTVNVLREYTYPNGTVAVREKVVYQGDDLVSFTLEELQTGGSGSAKIAGKPSAGNISFKYTKETGAKEKSHTEELRPDTIQPDMLAPFLVSHWDRLMKGEAVKCRYIVVPRRETVGFSFSKTSETTSGGKPVVVIKMEPSSPIISALVGPLFFTMEKGGQHHVLEYTGRCAPKIRDGKNWKDLDAVTVFDWSR